MPRATVTYRCADCGWTSPRWVGRCGRCDVWGSVGEESASRPGSRGLESIAPALPMPDVDATPGRAVPSGVDELDRVLGGGLVPGSVVLMAGEPGVGKSTLALEVAARAPGSALYLTGEETTAQVRQRADRTAAVRPALFLAAVRDLEEVLAHLEQVRPDLLVLDSVQTVTVPGVDSSAGGPAHVRAVAAALVAAAKATGTTVLLVGHVTKDGAVAGPRVLEHLVDVVLLFEGDRHSRLRLLRGLKNRFGPSDEVGCLDLEEGGITSVPDPSRLFLSASPEAVPGRCWTVALEGRRALPIEVQALLGPAGDGAPRRVATGLPPARLALLLAVLEQRCRLPVGGRDVYTATVGGLTVAEPAADLATALAVASAATGLALPGGVTAVGEVGLDGEVRAVGGLRHRVLEAARVGARRVLVPAAEVPGGGPVPPGPDGCDVVPVRTLSEALHRAPGTTSLRLVRPRHT